MERKSKIPIIILGVAVVALCGAIAFCSNVIVSHRSSMNALNKQKAEFELADTQYQFLTDEDTEEVKNIYDDVSTLMQEITEAENKMMAWDVATPDVLIKYIANDEMQGRWMSKVVANRTYKWECNVTGLTDDGATVIWYAFAKEDGLLLGYVEGTFSESTQKFTLGNVVRTDLTDIAVAGGDEE